MKRFSGYDCTISFPALLLELNEEGSNNDGFEQTFGNYTFKDQNEAHLSKGLMNKFDYRSLSNAEEVKDTYKTDNGDAIKAVKCGKCVCFDYDGFVIVSTRRIIEGGNVDERVLKRPNQKTVLTARRTTLTESQKQIIGILLRRRCKLEALSVQSVSGGEEI
ncbi:uncharacterized protein EV154DRAFT_553152 [Mucor mucedo]|uniref:uncharacterized protein n=1 Tax=Mucor mucedo TaxID=29922 RepID=UPI00221EC7E0|nr:uncharacterized protein EV154DRAFT_553152 [Mucor mucedo]KAI7889392.1 hypothetical protein EV154DRAFT_553152 [Mucor mucedo]